MTNQRCIPFGYLLNLQFRIILVLI